MLPTLDLGPLIIPTRGLVYILGAWLLLTAVEKAAERLGLHVPATYGVAVTALGTGFVGARLIFVALYWEAYRQHPLSIIWPLTSGFNLWGGLLIGSAAGFFYGRARRLPPGATLDALLPGLVIGLMAVSLADLLAGPGYGTETTLPWSIALFGVRRHPVQLYEILVGFLALATWWATLRRPHLPGHVFLVSIAVYAAGRLFVDAFRADPWLTDGGYHVLQIISLLVVLTSLFLLALRAGSEETTGRPLAS